MNPRIFALLGVMLVASGCGSSAPVRDQPPTVAGQPVPNQNIILDFTKRYDLHCVDGDSKLVFSRCRIHGYTGDSVRDASGKMSYELGNQFGRWLVVELPDGRMMFLPPNMIRYLEEAKN